MDVEKTIREYLPNVIHMSLGTSSNNTPWVCEVHFVYDEDLNIYFRSKTSRRHSQEIASNPSVAGNIVEQHDIDDRPRGVYFEGRCEILEDTSEQEEIAKLFCCRLGAKGDLVADAAQEEGHKFYKISVSTYYLFDKHEIDPEKNQKYTLPWKS